MESLVLIFNTADSFKPYIIIDFSGFYDWVLLPSCLLYVVLSDTRV